VVTPTVLNERICTTAASAGKPVLVEKPLARNSREAINIVETVARSGSLFMVGHTLRFNSVVRALEHHLDELGPIHTISMNQRLEPPERLWMDDFAEAGGGVILQTGIHMFDLLRYFSDDEVRRVYCETDRIVYEELEDSFVAIMRLRQSKARCLIDAARYTESRSGRIELVGEQGQLVGDHVHGYGMLIRGRNLTPLDIPPAVNTIEELLNTFLSAILNDEEPPITVVDGLHSLEIAEACYHSSSSGAAIELHDEDADGEVYDDDLDDAYWDA
jgi:predicted dehydrogenase